MLLRVKAHPFTELFLFLMLYFLILFILDINPVTDVCLERISFPALWAPSSLNWPYFLLYRDFYTPEGHICQSALMPE